MKLPADTIATEVSSSHYPVLKWDQGHILKLDDCVAEEVPIAMVYNGVSHAVMLASPQDLEDFAIGFSLSEGIISSLSEIYGIEVIHQPKGIELHIDLAAERFQLLKERRRSMSGRTGCGLCGAESLEQAMRIPTNVINIVDRISSKAIYKAHLHIRSQQKLQVQTGATHACAWVKTNGTIENLREDVGRHNALDKLIGAMARKHSTTPGFVLTTSRASYEMVQKVATAGIPILVAVSAPTGLAIRIAQNCGVTLVGFARNHQHVIYSRPERILHKEEA
ncbi:MAG TPA: formate dehydrogenase accessory sulfurtransferase FdhD [Methylophilaceae bacterium]